MKRSWKRSKPIINIPKSEIEDIPFFKGKTIHTLEIFQTGLKNTNYLVNLGLDAFVLRISDNQKMMNIENKVIELTSETLPVPKVLATGQIKVGSDMHPYSIHEFIPGEVFSTLIEQMDEDTKLTYYAESGKLLSKIIMYTFDQSGFMDENLTVVSPIPNNTAGFAQMFKELITKAVVKEHLGDLYFDLMEFVEANQHTISEIQDQITLCHADFNPENIIIDSYEDEIVGIIDWEFALAMNPFLDIGNFLRFEDDLTATEVGAFIHAVGSNGYAIPKHWKTIARLYDILALISMLDHDRVDKSRLVDITNRLEHYLSERYQTD